MSRRAQVIGLRHPRIILRYILPNSIPPVIVQATLTIAAAIIAEASLSFLGLGQQPPNPSWGIDAEYGQELHLTSALDVAVARSRDFSSQSWVSTFWAMACATQSTRANTERIARKRQEMFTTRTGNFGYFWRCDLDALACVCRRHGHAGDAVAMPSTLPLPAGFVLQVVEPHLVGPSGRSADHSAFCRGPERLRCSVVRVLHRQAATIDAYKALGLEWYLALAFLQQSCPAHLMPGWYSCAITAP